MYQPVLTITPNSHGQVSLSDECGVFLAECVRNGQSALLGLPALPAGTTLRAQVRLINSTGATVYQREVPGLLLVDQLVCAAVVDGVYDVRYSIYASNPISGVTITPEWGYLLARSEARSLVDWQLRESIGKIGLALLGSRSVTIGAWRRADLEEGFSLIHWGHQRLLIQAHHLPPAPVNKTLIELTRKANKLTAGIDGITV